MNYSNQKGVTLFMVMVILIMMTLLGITAMQTVAMQTKISKNFQDSVGALVEAENGIAIAKERLRTDPLGSLDDLENDIDLVGTGSVMPAGTYDYTIWGLSDATPTLKVAMITSNGIINTAPRTVHVHAKFLNTPVNADAALTLYDTGSIDLRGDPEINGNDHGVPNNFDCNGNGCQDTPAIPATDVTGVYSEDALDTLALIGTPTLDGSPAQQVGGGAYDTAFWEQYAADANGYATERNGSGWGTRDNPVVHIIDQNMGIMGNTDGAGILIIKDAAVSFGGNFHFEGQIILLSTGAGATITMGGTTRLFGALVVVGPNSVIDFGSAGTPELLYSSEALGNIGNAINWKTDGWIEERS